MTKNNNKNSHKSLYILALAIIIIIICLFIFNKGKNNSKQSESTTAIIDENNAENKTEEALFDLGNDLSITKIGKYSGTYMEDASDDKVENILAILVTNNGEKPLQYAEITLSSDMQEVDAQESATESEGAEKEEQKETESSDSAIFKLSTLNPGETVMVLESNRKAYDEDIEYTTATAQNVVFFTEELTNYEDQLQIQPLDGGFNITNISKEDITGEIMVYFKDCKDDMLYGGITYRGRIEGGLKAGEIRQIMTDNFTESNTKVMFITITDLEQ